MLMDYARAARWGKSPSTRWERAALVESAAA